MIYHVIYHLIKLPAFVTFKFFSKHVLAKTNKYNKLFKVRHNKQMIGLEGNQKTCSTIATHRQSDDLQNLQGDVDG